MTNKIKEDISMPEALAMINESLTKIQQQISDLSQRVGSLESGLDSLSQKIYEGFAYHETWLNRIEKNMSTKTQFNSLLKILERKDVVSKYEVSHIIGSELGV